MEYKYVLYYIFQIVVVMYSIFYKEGYRSMQEFQRALRRQQQSYIEYLLSLVPPTDTPMHPYERILHAAYHNDVSQQFLKQMGIQRTHWASLPCTSQRQIYIIKAIDKNIEESKKKIQLPKPICVERVSLTQPKVSWLKVDSKYPTLLHKLKAKIIQTLNDSQNGVRLQEGIKNKVKRVHLLKEEAVMGDFDDVQYDWTEEDEMQFIIAVNGLKYKCAHTSFLKQCRRFKCVSQHELDTMAVEEIARKLDKNNKVFLSRQFLLDKYYSTTQTLTQQEMRFILKTSPLLSKCVDKEFIKAALSLVPKYDISQLQLELAEDIIARFHKIRDSVRKSRMLYKGIRNENINAKIRAGNQKQQQKMRRQISRKQLQNYQWRQSKRELPHNNLRKGVIPLNSKHPSSALFTKECNEHCIQNEYNSYEMEYLKGDNISTPTTNMIDFYTGGPQQHPVVMSKADVEILCLSIKAMVYTKQMREALQLVVDETSCVSTIRTVSTVLKHKNEEDVSQCVAKINQKRNRHGCELQGKKVLQLAAKNQYSNYNALNIQLNVEQVNKYDQKGNTALLYACKHGNVQFAHSLLNFGARVSASCERKFTPLHYVFKTNNVNLISRCLATEVDLNAVNEEGKTPLAYCTREILAKFNLLEGIAVVFSGRPTFDNNSLLQKQSS